MLLHVDTMILTDTVGSDHSGNGCSTIMCNQKDVQLNCYILFITETG